MNATSVTGPVRSSNEFTTPAAKTSGTSGLADFDQFLNLFVNQLKYQDPLSPQKGDEFLAQTAQFSSVEQLVNLNKGMTGMETSIGLFGKSTAASFIGKKVDALITETDGTKTPVSGRVLQLDIGQGGALTLKLDDGVSIPFDSVTSVTDA